MQIDEKLLQKLEKLSALKLTDDEKNKVLNDMHEILEFAEVMSEVDLNGIKDLSSISNSYTPLREDCVIQNDAKDIILENAKSEDGYFIVPKIIEWLLGEFYE